MPSNNSGVEPGARLKARRISLGITIRDVELYSQRIAELTGKPAFFFPRSSLSAAEKKTKSPPDIYRLFSLSVIYRIKLFELLLIYGVDPDEISKYQTQIGLPNTSLVPAQMYDPNRRVVFPTQFEAEIDLRSTQVLSYLVKTWGEIPMAFIQHLQLHEYLYGFIGTTDFTMYPFVRPGTLVQIDDRDKKVRATGWSTDFDRPIYFFQLRDRYAFGWCQIEKNTLSIIPYEASRRPVRTFAYPDQIEVIGRVTRAVMSFMPTDQATGRPSSS